MKTFEYAGETNPLPEGFHDEGWTRTVDWSEKGLQVTRLRLISDLGFPFWDVSYCFGMIGSEKVKVSLPFNQLSKFGWKGEIISYAKRQGIYAKGLGILDNVSTLI
jgi:hypothetical protein